MGKKKKSYYYRDPWRGGQSRSFRHRCIVLVREQRARFYILRRCVVMLVCWRERREP
ncbi:hypothetical protein J5N97_028746 [Dioscorea zingiberensis]|uniref:Uncharacterized protein n=1 Tax=Dioscorea zingiberensis TaxID=325984 RepID=A0A9D5C011_9LILI|nr:hypothetical protein J5N97_028746 [Dioscorea zingiberensis]